MQRTLAGRHAVVTGGGRGIGAAIAAMLARHGASIGLLGRNMEALNKVAAELRDTTRTAVVTTNVADADAVHAAFGKLRAELGPVHILINNAGQALSAPFERTDEALWRRLLDVNLTGTYLCTREALPDMLAAGYGRIVNIASTAGLRGHPYVTAYCASKHGVVGLTRALALEVATKNITVNAVCPGYTDTDMVTDAVENIRSKTGRPADEIRAAITAGNPQGRLVRPEEVANAVEWLCLPGSESITAQSIVVSGGAVM